MHLLSRAGNQDGNSFSLITGLLQRLPLRDYIQGLGIRDAYMVKAFLLIHIVCILLLPLCTYSSPWGLDYSTAFTMPPAPPASEVAYADTDPEHSRRKYYDHRGEAIDEQGDGIKTDNKLDISPADPSRPGYGIHH